MLYIKNNLNEPSIANKYAKMIKEEIKTLGLLNIEEYKQRKGVDGSIKQRKLKF